MKRSAVGVAHTDAPAADIGVPDITAITAGGVLTIAGATRLEHLILSGVESVPVVRSKDTGISIELLAEARP